MSDDNDWYFCLSDHTVRQGKESRGLDRMGPYPSEAAAAQALEIARARNKAADDADSRWDE
ncbi:hypothetical protein [Tomitella biformata]|uniref:hypothetical protein n=1 Tax=Tomitella biformata TaxID=630403 RepID=UPI00046538AA|nr:hypothetical protein [Tomitella biformata]